MDYNYGGSNALMTERQRPNDGRGNDVSKSFADLKVKLSQKRRLSGARDGDNDSRPSDISEDEWAEIVRY